MGKRGIHRPEQNETRSGISGNLELPEKIANQTHRSGICLVPDAVEGPKR